MDFWDSTFVCKYHYSMLFYFMSVVTSRISRSTVGHNSIILPTTKVFVRYRSVLYLTMTSGVKMFTYIIYCATWRSSHLDYWHLKPYIATSLYHISILFHQLYVFLPIVPFFSQLAEAYRNLQNTNRRHLNVHEPLIYDAVWLTAEVLNMSLPVLSESNLTLNSSQRSPALISALNSALESNTYSGLTVRCCFAVFVLYDIIFST